MSRQPRSWWNRIFQRRGTIARPSRLRPRLELLENRLAPAVDISATKVDTLLVDNDGDGVADPGDTIQYAISITNSGDTDATGVTYTDVVDPNTTLAAEGFLVSPLALRRGFASAGNTPLTVDAASGLKVGVVDIDGVTPNVNLVVTAGTFPTTQGGSVTINADGSFTYTPQTGDEGVSDTFTYTITDTDGLSSTAVVTVAIGQSIWFVDSAAAPGGDGSFATPFQTLTPLNNTAADVDDDGDTIFVYERGVAYTGGITLEGNQSLIGDGVAFTANGMNIGASTNNSVIVNTGGDDVTLGSGNTLRGLTIGSASDSTGVAIIGTSFGTLTVSDVIVDTNGAGLQLLTGSFSAGSAFTSVSSRGGSYNILLNTVTGAVDFGGGVLQAATAANVSVSAGSVSATYSGNITQANAQPLAIVNAGHTGTLTFSGTLSATNGLGLGFNDADGTYNFNGTTTLNGGDARIDIVSGSSGTFSFGTGTSITHNAAGTAFNLNGSNANVTYSGSITDNDGRAVDIDNHDAGTVTFQTGSISANGASAQGIRVANSNGTSIVNFNGQVTLSTQGNTAVDLTSNSGGAINFNAAGNGLDITTTSGTGFSATGGGTVTVQGSGNTISSGTGTALNIANTTIGASDVTFRSISANGASSGIILNTTGSLGGLTVTGDGNTSVGGNSSGGEIQNTTGAGIALTNSRDVSLTNMNIHNTVGSGVDGFDVTNFTFANGTIDRSGLDNSNNVVGGVGTSNIYFGDEVSGINNLDGVVSITGNALTNAFYHGVRIYNESGIISNLIISNNTMTATGLDASSDGSGIAVDVNGSASTAAAVTQATVSSNTINNFFSGAGIQLQGGNGAQGPAVTVGVPDGDNVGGGANLVSITANVIGNASIVGGIGTNGILVGVSGTGQGNFSITNNGTAGVPIQHFKGIGIAAFGGNRANVNHFIDNNFIDASDNIANSSGMSVGSQLGGNDATQNGTVKAEITNNTINGMEGNGILAGITNSFNTGFFKIVGNTVGNPQAGVRPGIRVESGSANGDATVFLEISGNTSGGSSGHAGIGLRKQGSVASVNEFNIEGLSPSPANHAQMETFVSSQNPGSVLGTGNGGGPSRVLSISGENYQSGNVAFLMAASAGAEVALADAGTPPAGTRLDTTPPSDAMPPADSTAPANVTLQDASDRFSSGDQPAATPVIVDDGVLTQDEIDIFVAAALERWSATGLDAEQLAFLQSVTFEIADMPAWYLGSATPGHITIDSDAAGYGWFLDVTPFDDSEFTPLSPPFARGETGGSPTRLYTDPSGAPAGRYDLLTTVMHELGHQLGLPDYYSLDARDNLMYGFLTLGERRLPASGQADGLTPGSIAATAFIASPINIGQLDAGTTINIRANVTVNSPFTGSTPQVSNQGSVSGGNFATVLTDDPSVGGTADPTVTPIDTLTLGNLVWSDTNGNGLFDSGTESGVNGVVLNLYLDTDASNTFTPGTDTFLATTTTASGGLYQFTGLQPGDYIVQVDPSNFNIGGALFGLPISTAGNGVPAPDPDDNVDNDDNGDALPGFGVVSRAITLSFNNEPTPGTGNDTNNTLDFGFVNLITDLQVTKSESTEPVIAGANGGVDNLTYTVIVTNNGPDGALGVVVTETLVLPAGVTISNSTSASQGSFDSNTGIWTVGDLADDASATLTLVLNVAADAADGAVIQNTAVVTSITTDPTPGNNTDTENTTIATQADLSVTKTDSPDPVFTGENITYTLTVSNNGPSDAQDVTLTDTVPANTTFAGFSSISQGIAIFQTGVVTASFGTIAAGASATLVFVVTVNAGTTDGTIISNTADVSSTTTDPDALNNSVTQETTVSAVDLVVTKDDAPDPVIAGTDLTFTITVTNAAVATTAENVLFSDVLPTGTTFVSLTAPAGWTPSTPAVGGTGTVTATNPLFAAGATAVFTLVVRVGSDVADGATLSNTADVTNDIVDSNLTNNSDTESTDVIARADLSVAKADDPDPVRAGENITYTLTVTNSGPSDAQDVTLTDTVPANTTFAGFVNITQGIAVFSAGVVTADFGTITAGASATLVFVVTVSAATPDGTLISNTADVTATTTDPDLLDNSITQTTAVNAEADLSVVKTDSPDPVIAGNDLTYTIIVTNNGPSDAQSVDLSDVLPAGTTFVSLSAPGGWSATTPAVGATGTVNASIGTLPAGSGPQVFTLVVAVAASVPDGATLSNTADVTSTTTDPVAGNNSATQTTDVIAEADLAVTKTDSPDPVIAGTNLTYTLTLSNVGPSDAQNVVLSDLVPANTTFVSFTQDSGPAATSVLTPSVGGTGTASATFGTLSAGATATFTLVVQVALATPDGTIISNTVSAASDTTDPNSANDSDTEMTAVQIVDLSVTKSDSPDPVVAGTDLTYTITVANLGSADAREVALSDLLPAGTTFVSFTTPAGWSAITPAVGGTGTVTASIATLAAGSGPQVFTLVVHVGANVADGSTLSNTAAVTTTTPDQVAGNNSDTETTDVIAEADLAVVKTDSPDPVIAGTDLTYTITVTNSGTSDAQNVVLSDVVPANTTFVSFVQDSGPPAMLDTPAVGGTGTVTASIPTLAAGASATFTFVVHVAAGTLQGSTITNTADVASGTTDPTPGNNSAVETTAVIAEADLAVAKTDAPDPVVAGHDLTYTIIVTNAGPSDAQNVSLSDLLPPGTTFVSWTAPGGWTSMTPAVGGTGTVTATISTLPTGATAEFTLVVNVGIATSDGTIVTNTADVASTTTDAVAGNNSATSETTVRALDYGDAPDTYATLAASNGPTHRTGSALFLGATAPDNDADGQPSADALGDDAAGVDDEDGVAFTALFPGLVTTVSVVASTAGRLDGFFDFNGDGDFADAGEQLFDNVALVPGTNTFDFVVPVSAVAGSTFARFRVSSAGGLSFDGAALDGEIEDYAVSIAPVALGTSGNDRIRIRAVPNQPGAVVVKRIAGGTATRIQTFAPGTRVVVMGLGGDDDIKVIGNTRRVYVFGGGGDDVLVGGSNHDVLIGGTGRDRLVGKQGRDLLIGGAGPDQLDGGADSDILVAGTTDFDAHLAGLNAVMREWTSDHSYANRTANLRNGSGTNPQNEGYFLRNNGAAATVHDDGKIDTLVGGLERDWFFARLGEPVADAIVGLEANEEVRRV